MGSKIPTFLDRIVSFPDGRTYEMLEPLTDFRKCHDGRPLEARIVVTCRQILPDDDKTETEYVMKVKVQAPDPSLSLPSSAEADEQQHPGPSTTTAAELKALGLLTHSQTKHTPHLIAFKTATQGPNGLLPGGFLSFLVMTKMPGRDLLALQFWHGNDKHAQTRRDEIVAKFLGVLRSVYDVGVEPVDCALRNVLWEEESKTCSIIDFELWREATTTDLGDERKELERWGLAKRKAPISWWAEWQISGH